MRRALAIALLAAMIGGDDPPPIPPTPSVPPWARGPMEVRLQYWPQLDKGREKAIIEDVLKKAIPYYEIAWEGDKSLPKGAPLGRLRITGAKVVEQGGALILATDPHPRRAVYVLDWIDTPPGRARYDYSGVVTAWHYSPDDPPLPAMPLAYSRLWNLTIRPGHGGQDMSRRPDYPRDVVLWTSLLVPKDTKETLVLRGNMPFTATVGDAEAKANGAKDKPEAAEIPIESTGDPIELTITLTTAKIGPAWEFGAFWKRDGKEIPVPPSQLALPWMPPERSATEVPAPPFDLAGGDATRGEAVFRSEEAKCATCHAAGGKGGNVGPALDGQKDRKVAEIYHDIAEPSARIDPEYRTYTVALKDGQVAVGIVRAEGFDKIRVLDINGKATEVPKSEIEEMTASATSTMPVGLAGALGEAKMRDLIAFLKGGK